MLNKLRSLIFSDYCHALVVAIGVAGIIIALVVVIGELVQFAARHP